LALFTKRYHEPGTLPGTLVATVCEAPLRITLVEFTDEAFEERVISSPSDCVSPEECREYLASPSKTWIHVQGCVTPDALRQLGEMFGLHVLALEDVLNTGQRTKLEDYDSQLFLVMHLPLRTDAGLEAQQISLFLGPNYLISFHAGAKDPFEPVRARLRQHVGRIRQRGTDFLLHALVDLIVDQGFPLLEEFGEDIESIEQTLLGRPDEAVLVRIHHLRRELLLLRRLIWPQSEVLRQLLHEDYGCIEEKTRVFLRDCHDHALHILELLESYREMTSVMLEAYLSSASNQLNEVMRVLTVIATIFMPLTFIVGVYGMNFSVNETSPWAMPELHWYYGYPAVWLVIVAVFGGMLVYFRRKRWF
jgi:magnesium transporter